MHKIDLQDADKFGPIIDPSRDGPAPGTQSPYPDGTVANGRYVYIHGRRQMAARFWYLAHLGSAMPDQLIPEFQALCLHRAWLVKGSKYNNSFPSEDDGELQGCMCLDEWRPK